MACPLPSLLSLRTLGMFARDEVIARQDLSGLRTRSARLSGLYLDRISLCHFLYPVAQGFSSLTILIKAINFVA